LSVSAPGSVRERVPLADPRADLAPLRTEILDAIARVVDSGGYILGQEVATFEQQLAQRVGASGAVGVGSGTDALVLALLAVGVLPGDEVITVSHTAGPTVAAICMIGAIPVLVDVDPVTYCLDPATLGPAFSSRTKAVIPVHLYGHPADLGSIKAFAGQHGIAIVEDCAQAQEAAIEGRPVGGLGDVGCFSFYPTKNLGAIGDGGLVTAANAELVERLRRLRTYGWSKPQFADIVGGRCSRLDELQAAVLNVKLEHLAADVAHRRAIARRYDEAFSDLPLVPPVERAGYRHAYHLYVIRSESRDALAQHLDRAGVATGVHYPYPVHVQPGLATQCRVPQPLHVTETISREILTLPLYPSMSSEKELQVIDAVRSFFGGAASAKVRQ
jgi:dTDP-4-amino-4,6-dideoxygalactose transaminase